MAGEATGIFHGVGSLIEGAAAAFKGIYHPSLPLTAKIRPINDLTVEGVQKAWGTVSIVGGRAYLFGGVDSVGNLASNSMHIIHLPTTDVESTDYEELPASASSPPSRCVHTATVIDSQIYVYGGSSSADINSPKPIDENGRVWVFDTQSNTWSSLLPDHNTPIPRTPVFAVSSSTSFPKPQEKPSDENPHCSSARADLLPKHDLDPLATMPEPVEVNTYGSLFIYGGQHMAEDSSLQTNSNDMWIFDISSRTWSRFPSPPHSSPSTLSSPNLALVDNKLYTYIAPDAQTYALELDMRSIVFEADGPGEFGPSPLGPWTAIPAPDATSSPPPDHTASTHSSNEEKADSGGGGKEDATEASLVPITTGQGRNYLVLISTTTTGADTEPSPIYTLQLAPTSKSSASLKDSARSAMHKSTNRDVWAQVTHYYNNQNVLRQESQAGREVGVRRRGGMVAKMGTMDGGAVLVWGGVGGRGEVGDGVGFIVDFE
ncbi:hypothetical protein AAFC00_006030 [Neodothiora populina]|uniref:Galactose oxidase n=1 Tax=Neodothiora populina TaxID=2781224 RepID=A0ABR3P6Q0_9PEZI